MELTQLPPDLDKVDRDHRESWSLAIVATLLDRNQGGFETKEGLRAFLATGRPHVMYTLKTTYKSEDLKDEDFERIYAKLCRAVAGPGDRA